jgi:hypothetical protein
LTVRRNVNISLDLQHFSLFEKKKVFEFAFFVASFDIPISAGNLLGLVGSTTDRSSTETNGKEQGEAERS